MTNDSMTSWCDTQFVEDSLGWPGGDNRGGWVEIRQPPWPKGQLLARRQEPASAPHPAHEHALSTLSPSSSHLCGSCPGLSPLSPFTVK